MKIYQKWSLPKKNNFIHILTFLKFPLLIWFLKQILLRQIKNSRNLEIIYWFKSFYGNIYSEDVVLNDTFCLDYDNIYIWKWTKFWFENMIITWSHDYSDNLQNFDTVITKPVNIWKNCWITSRCIIMPWVNIWDNTIIQAWSVVTNDIPNDCIAWWNPCKVIKFK